MNEFFEGMTNIEQTYWIIALIGSTIFLFIFVLTFVGVGDTDMEIDIEQVSGDDGGVGFQFFTFKNLVAFLTIFGWTGIICIGNNLSGTMTIVVSSIAGLLMMTATSFLFLWISRLSHSGTLRIKNAIGVIGEVYLPIGANRSKMGKIQITVQGSLRELEAITDNNEELKTNSIIKVTDVISGELLLVEKFSK
ncbi:MAG: hypothetical protein HRT66_12185 [Flavobacteriaceae bacterium]|nr:hypothetical protein [Flavobacteriaceae bacterium]